MTFTLLALMLGLASPARAELAKQPDGTPPITRVIVPDPTALSIDERMELYRDARMEKARKCAKDKDILGWGKALFPDKFPAEFCAELHEYLVKVRAEDFTSTEAPRGHAKTTIKCFLIPIFQALEEPQAFRFYLNVQATDDKALAINRSIKLELETNRELREIYGDQVGDRWTDQEFVLKNGVVFVARSAGQSIKGINYRNVRPDYILVDDLYNEEDLTNIDSTQKKNAWFWGTLYKTKAVGRRTSVHVIGTAVNNYDLMMKLAADPTVKARTFRAVKDDGSLLWGAIWNDPSGRFKPIELVEREKDRMGSIIWAREMQNDRWDETSAIIKRSWLDHWEYDPSALSLDPKKRRLINVYLLVDPSIGKNMENDETAMVVLYKTLQVDGAGAQAPEYWIDYAVAERMTLNQRIDKLKAIQAMRPENTKISRCLIEAISGFQDFGEQAKKSTTLPVTLVDKVKDKIANLMNKSAHFESGRVHLNKNLPNALKEKIVFQLTTNQPKHDDLRDALLLGLDSNAVSVWDRLG